MGPDHSTTLDTQETEKYYKRRKFILLGLTFFFTIFAYTIIQALKDSVFSHIVGLYWLNYARYGSLFVLTPAIFIYSKLVDKMRRYYLLCFYASIYVLLCLIFAYFLGDPIIGIPNTNNSVNRIFGWLFYFFVEGFSPFVVSVFWAFLNSISSPKGAKKQYGSIAACSKVGGMMSAGLGWLLLGFKGVNGAPVLSDAVNHQLLLIVTAVSLSGIPFMVIWLMRTVPGHYLHGYEAAYKVEKMKKKIGKADTGILVGIKMLLQYPYVLGIFGMIFFYELINTVLSFLRVGVAQASSQTMSEVSAQLLGMSFWVHFLGFFISFFGTRTLLMKLGERVCLLLIPGSMAFVLTIFVFHSTNSFVIYLAYVLVKAVNFAFGWPVRESLYIPTIKEIKFKSKSWIDAFGSKFAKSTGASFNIFAGWLGPVFFVPVHSIFFFIVIINWIATAWLLGKRFERAVKNNEVIGLEKPLAELEEKQTLTHKA